MKTNKKKQYEILKAKGKLEKLKSRLEKVKKDKMDKDLEYSKLQTGIEDKG